MPNHIHVIVELTEGTLLQNVLQTWKSSSSHLINKALERHGRLWHADYYNYIIRTPQEYAFQVSYVFRNNKVCSWRLR